MASKAPVNADDVATLGQRWLPLAPAIVFKSRRTLIALQVDLALPCVRFCLCVFCLLCYFVNLLLYYLFV